jgi:hypothetical protein
MICNYETTCPNKTTTCLEETMPELHAKPIVDGKFWIVEQDGNKVGVLKITEQKKYVLSSKENITTFDTKKKIVEQFGSNFFVKNKFEREETVEDKTVYGYPSSTTPFNPLYDVKRHLPLFTKSSKSKSIYCAGYYIIKFEKGWVKSFCPKLITIERYPYEGPFRTELERKQRLASVTKQ